MKIRQRSIWDMGYGGIEFCGDISIGPGAKCYTLGGVVEILSYEFQQPEYNQRWGIIPQYKQPAIWQHYRQAQWLFRCLSNVLDRAGYRNGWSNHLEDGRSSNAAGAWVYRVPVQASPTKTHVHEQYQRSVLKSRLTVPFVCTQYFFVSGEFKIL